MKRNYIIRPEFPIDPAAELRVRVRTITDYALGYKSKNLDKVRFYVGRFLEKPENDPERRFQGAMLYINGILVERFEGKEYRELFNQDNNKESLISLKRQRVSVEELVSQLNDIICRNKIKSTDEEEPFDYEFDYTQTRKLRE